MKPHGITRPASCGRRSRGFDGKELSRSLTLPQLVLICIPADWNGNLVLCAHGFVPSQAPLILPVVELTLPDKTFVPSLLLAQGFAFATSSFHKNGAATEQAVKDLGDLLNYFKKLMRHQLLKNVFIIGASEGGLPVMRLIEKQPDEYDAALALCASVGGAPEQVRYFEDFRVVFDYFFPRVFTFPPGAPGEQPFGAFRVPEEAFFWYRDYKPRIRDDRQQSRSGCPIIRAQDRQYWSIAGLSSRLGLFEWISSGCLRRSLRSL